MTVVTTPEQYAAEWERWHAARVAELARPDGWLSITSITWLLPGANKTIEGFPGSFRATKAGVAYTPDASETATVRATGETVDAAATFAPQVDGASVTLAAGGKLAEIINRSGSYAVRIRDPKSPGLLAFHGVDHFEPNPAWVVPARFERFEQPRREQVNSVLGTVTHNKQVVGLLHFAIDGHDLTLEAYDDGAESPTVIFTDATSGDETYGAGRFLYLADQLDRPDPVIDFNRAINPPCAFSEFCTCAVASPRNRLSVRVEAGEKNPHNH